MNVPVLVKVNDPRLSVLEFKVKVVFTFRFDPRVKSAEPLSIKVSKALLVPGEV